MQRLSRNIIDRFCKMGNQLETEQLQRSVSCRRSSSRLQWLQEFWGLDPWPLDRPGSSGVFKVCFVFKNRNEKYNCFTSSDPHHDNSQQSSPPTLVQWNQVFHICSSFLFKSTQKKPYALYRVILQCWRLISVAVPQIKNFRWSFAVLAVRTYSACSTSSACSKVRI